MAEVADDAFDLDVLYGTDVDDLPFAAYFNKVTGAVPDAHPADPVDWVRGGFWAPVRGAQWTAIHGGAWAEVRTEEPWTSVHGGPGWAPVRGHR